MKRFISENDVNMVEGPTLNWEDLGSDIFYISVGEPFSTINCVDFHYYLHETILSINGQQFFIETIAQAEDLIRAYAKANNYEIRELYLK